VVGKAILFARKAFAFPAEGPWSGAVNRPQDDWSLPDYADIPAPGACIHAGWPVLTALARGSDVAACAAALRERVAALGDLLA
jgi:hypothetical protein